MEVVRHFLGFAEDSDARAAEMCVGAVLRRQVPGVAGWPQGLRQPPRVAATERKGGRQRPSDESRTTALSGCAALPGLKAACLSATQTETAARMPQPKIVCKAQRCTLDFFVQGVP